MHNKRTKEQFIALARSVHGDKYQYIGEYLGGRIPIDIECKKHGLFSQKPEGHLQGYGCPKCGGSLLKTHETFLAEATIVHGERYLYPGKYINSKTSIEIECRKHGVFVQMPNDHLRGYGCSKCKRGNIK